ncbi:unnamed protein product, partial [Brenthis ino]
MSREKREADYPVELESQFIMRMPEEPGKVLGELIKSGENFKNRLSIHIHDDMRHGEVRLDHWLLYAKIVDLPTIVESWKSIDRKSLYKCADICQMMLCKEELDPITEDELPTKNKKKDPLKVDKKYLWPHGITPPTKNVRKRRFRKTLRKKCTEAPEIEKEVKRLLRADNEAVSVTWEVVKEDEGNTSKNEASGPSQKVKIKKESTKAIPSVPNQSSKVEDIFGGALSDSDIEDDNVNIDIDDSRLSAYDEPLSDTNSLHVGESMKATHLVTEFKSEMFDCSLKKSVTHKSSALNEKGTGSSYQVDMIKHQSFSGFNDSSRLQELVTELEELKQRKQRTQVEIFGIENMTLKQRFQDILKSLNKDIVIKEMEYQNLKSQLK